MRRSVLIIAVVALPVSIAAFVGPAYRNGPTPARSLFLHQDFESGTLSDWDMPHPEDWEIRAEDGLHHLHMVRPRDPGVPRRPLQFARLKNVRVGSFDLRVRVRRTGRSMIVVFNYVDTLHFYYVHLSHDPGTAVAVHNGIFIVNGAPRRRITGELAPPALPDHSWHLVHIVRDVRSGSVKVFMDQQSHPLFSAVDRTFACGQIGLGSFDETGDFAQFQLSSTDVGCSTSQAGKRALPMRNAK
ncbi:MAG TPA: hypothetical protein VMX16_14155 [Terriglobia bacterium]|nr:hypothetical protein [Terriglobia bacterium]